jgi:phosphoglucosamine mutase
VKNVQQKIFGTSGIRGIINKELTSLVATQIGQAVASYTKGGKILIGFDTRLSSPMLEYAVTAGLTSGGSTVYRTGIVPTPTLAFLTKELRMDTGIMITASHNPPQYNGIKLFNKNSMAYAEEQQEKIERIITNKKYDFTLWKTIGKSQTINEIQKYVNMVLDSVRLRKRWRIILDVGNGATYQLAPKILRSLGCHVTTINSQPDGTFPGRGALPEGEALQPLCNIVQKLKADMGIAYDGDGDRMVTVDEKGKPTPPDQTMAAYAAYLVRRNKGGVMVTHVETSACIEEMIEKYGGKVIRTKVGDVSISSAIKKHKAIFGGEPCGAWIHPEIHYCPDGILSTVLLIKALQEENRKMSEFVSEAPKYYIERKNIECPNRFKHMILAGIDKNIDLVFPQYLEKLELDGLRLKLKEGWVSIRPSGTEPLIRVTVEAKSKQYMKRTMKKCLSLIKKALKEKNL